MAGYTRADTDNNIADGNVINAADLDNEFDSIEAAFNAGTGHTHDGTDASGASITKVGPAQDVVVGITSVLPKTTNTMDLGGEALQFKDLHIDGTAHIDSLTLTSGSTVTTVLDEDNMASDSATALATQQSIKAYVDSQISANNDLSEILTNDNTTGGTDIAVSAGDDITFTSTSNAIFADNAKAIFGAGSDLQIYHDGSNSYIDDAGTGNLLIRGSAITRLQSYAGEDMVVAVTNGAVNLYYDNAAKLATTSTGIDVTGNATFADNGKAIFGAGSDLQIYHDGSASYIAETGTGPLNIQMESTSTAIGSGSALINFLAKTGASLHTAANLSIHQPATTEGVGDFRFSVGDGAGVLTEALRVNSTGIDVTGTVVSDGLTVEGASAGTFTAATFRNTTGAGGTRVQAVLQNVGIACDVNLVSERVGANSGADFIVETSDGSTGLDIQRLRISEIGDISFYEDTGTTPKFFWDASAESLGIGTSSPSSPLEVNGGTTNRIASFISTDGTSLIEFADNGTSNRPAIGAEGNDLSIVTGGSGETVRVTSEGKVGINTTTPATLLELSKSNNTLAGSPPNNILRFNDTDTTVATNQPTGRIEFYVNDAEAGGTGIGSYIEGRASGTAGGGYLAFADSASGATGATEKMRLIDGNVGIGTSSPSSMWSQAQRLVVGAGTGNEGIAIYSSTTGNSRIAFVDTLTSTSGLSTGGLITYDHTNDKLLFKVTGTDRVTVDSSGNVGIGTTTPAYKLEIVDASSRFFYDTSNFGIVTNTAGGYGRFLKFWNSDASGDNQAVGIGTLSGRLVFGTGFQGDTENPSDGEAMSILADGTVGIGTSTPNSSVALEVRTSSDVPVLINSTDLSNNLVLADNTGSIGLKNYGGEFRLQTSGDALNFTGQIERFRVGGTEAVFNEPGNDVDFRIESDNSVNAFFVDGATSNIGINTAAPATRLEIAGSTGNGPIYTASISGTTMTVTAVTSGTIEAGQLVFGANIQAGTRIIATISGAGGQGTYVVSVSQTAASGTTYSSGNAYGTNILRITSSDTVVSAGQLDGMIQFYGSDASAPGVGVTSYIASVNESGTPDTALVFGTRDNGNGSVDANERVRITSTGNVGIGTSSPSQLLEVRGAAARIRITDTDTSGTTGIEFVDSANTVDAEIEVGNSTQYFAIKTAGSEAMRIDSAGNVGIGTDAPASIVSGTAATAIVTIGGGDGSLVTGDRAGTLSFKTDDASYKNTFADGIVAEVCAITSSAVGAAYDLAFYTGSTSGRGERLRIDSAGNVGIGTSSPSALLSINAATNGAYAQRIGVSDPGTGTVSSVRIGFDVKAIGENPQPAAYIGVVENSVSSVQGSLTFATRQTNNNTIEPTEAMRIDSAGAVLIGGTNTSSAHALDTGSGSLFLQSQTNDANIGLSIYVNEGANNRRAAFFLDDSLGVYGVEGTATSGIPDFVIRRAGNEIARFTGDGLTFNGDTAAANALDDYEEGTWSPILADALTGGNTREGEATSALYIKVGSLVTIQCQITNFSTAGLTGANDLFIRNLPFVAASVTGTMLVPGSVTLGATAFSGSVNPVIFDNTSYLRFAESSSGGVVDYLIVSQFTSGTADIYVNITYQAA
jgi:hypothetical protein